MLVTARSALRIAPALRVSAATRSVARGTTTAPIRRRGFPTFARASLGDPRARSPISSPIGSPRLGSVFTSRGRGLRRAASEGDVTLNQCDVYMDYKLFSGDATPYYDYYSGSHPLAPTSTALENAIVAQEAKTVADPNPVGMDPNSLVDECAAAVCMACYCSDYVAESDDDTYCMKYSMDNIMRALFGGVATVIAAVLNVLVKTLSIWLSEKEHHHSYTDFEKSVTWKIMSVMMLIMVLLPLFMTANIPAASLGFLFNGEHKDFSPWWYSEFATKFQQVAFINAFSLPFSMASKVIVFELKRRFLAGGVKTQTQLDELYTPPRT